jgi:hypothetical protein
MIIVTRTSGDAIGNAVTVQGFTFDGVFRILASNNGAVVVDRVSGFRIRENLMQRADLGVVTRLASGTIEGNLLAGNGEATSVTGGSIAQPATVLLRANRATGNIAHGFMHLAAGVVNGIPSAGSNPPDIAAAISQPLQTIFDRSKPDDLRNIPDTLRVTLRDNDASNNGQLGFRFMGNIPQITFSTADVTQPLTGTLRATLVGNTGVDNGDYGVDIEGAFTWRSEPRRFVQNLSLRLKGNSFVGNGRAPALFTFRHWRAPLGFEPLELFKFAEDSTYRVTGRLGELNGFDYEHFATDPLSGAVLGNRLIVDHDDVPYGARITVP